MVVERNSSIWLIDGLPVCVVKKRSRRDEKRGGEGEERRGGRGRRGWREKERGKDGRRGGGREGDRERGIRRG